MAHADRASGLDADTSLGRRRLRAAALRDRAHLIAARAEAQRSQHATVDIAYDLVDRDVEVGGGIIAGALAYRLFIWTLPLALVLVAGLGIAAEASSASTTTAAGKLGLTGLVSTSVASAAKSSSRWYALAVGVPILVYATRSVLRALIGAHRLVWTDLRAAAPRPTVGATLRLLGVMVCMLLVSAGAAAARAWSPGVGVLVSVAATVPYAGLWLLVSMRLPHRGLTWEAVLPGAVVFGIGAELLQIAAAYVIAPMALNKQGTYGALGIAATLLLALFLMGRLIVGSALLNVTLADRARAAPDA